MKIFERATATSTAVDDGIYAEDDWSDWSSYSESSDDESTASDGTTTTAAAVGVESMIGWGTLI